MLQHPNLIPQDTPPFPPGTFVEVTIFEYATYKEILRQGVIIDNTHWMGTSMTETYYIYTFHNGESWRYHYDNVRALSSDEITTLLSGLSHNNFVKDEEHKKVVAERNSLKTKLKRLKAVLNDLDDLDIEE